MNRDGARDGNALRSWRRAIKCSAGIEARPRCGISRIRINRGAIAAARGNVVAKSVGVPLDAISTRDLAGPLQEVKPGAEEKIAEREYKNCDGTRSTN